jgi:hypothetical protein
LRTLVHRYRRGGFAVDSPKRIRISSSPHAFGLQTIADSKPHGRDDPRTGTDRNAAIWITLLSCASVTLPR